eukprot:COSAG05_NODE_5984_length_1045_cov_1.841438_2_plen_83_part_01
MSGGGGGACSFHLLSLAGHWSSGRFASVENRHPRRPGVHLRVRTLKARELETPKWMRQGFPDKITNEDQDYEVSHILGHHDYN